MKVSRCGKGKTVVKLTLYIAGGFAAILIAILLITGGQEPAGHPAVMFAFVAIFAIPPFGAFWMMYMSINVNSIRETAFPHAAPCFHSVYLPLVLL
jgi:hypothetical protein